MIKPESPLATAILTVVRAEWPVKKLQIMSTYGEDTPASGDALARRANGFGQEESTK